MIGFVIFFFVFPYFCHATCNCLTLTAVAVRLSVLQTVFVACICLCRLQSLIGFFLAMCFSYDIFIIWHFNATEQSVANTFHIAILYAIWFCSLLHLSKIWNNLVKTNLVLESSNLNNYAVKKVNYIGNRGRLLVCVFISFTLLYGNLSK